MKRCAVPILNVVSQSPKYYQKAQFKVYVTHPFIIKNCFLVQMGIGNIFSITEMFLIYGKKLAQGGNLQAKLCLCQILQAILAKRETCVHT